jgi:hypothetical protein
MASEIALCRKLWEYQNKNIAAANHTPLQPQNQMALHGY